MLDWQTAEQAIVDAIKATSGCGDELDVRWKWQANAWRQGIAIVLDRSPMRSYGRDESRRTFDAAANAMDVAQVGPRAFSVTVRVESLRGANGYGALPVIETIRTRIFRPSVRADLRTAGLAISSVGPINRADFSAAGRDVSCALAEFVFLAMENDLDDSMANTWIEHVHVQSRYLTSDGVTHVDPQVDKVIP